MGGDFVVGVYFFDYVSVGFFGEACWVVGELLSLSNKVFLYFYIYVYSIDHDFSGVWAHFVV